MEIKILDTGCPNCKSLERIAREVVEKEYIEANVIKVENIIETNGA